MDEQPDCFDKTSEQICNFLISPLEYRIVQIAKNDQIPVQSLGKAIAGEPLLAVRLLRVANLISGLPQALSTVAQSIRVLGLDQLKALTLGISFLSLSQVLTTEKKAESADDSVTLRQIWDIRSVARRLPDGLPQRSEMYRPALPSLRDSCTTSGGFCFTATQKNITSRVWR